MELLKTLFALVGALLIFTLGLLAWRQQLLDKRRFEVAEQVLVMFAKLVAQIRILRQRHNYAGMSEWIGSELGEADHTEEQRYRKHMARREWQYRIPEEKQKAFNEVYKDFTPTVALARMYLSGEIVTALQRIEDRYELVVRAANVLVYINPDPSIDPHNQSDEHGEHIIPSWPYGPDEPDEQEAIEKEKEHFPIRFEKLREPDAFDIKMDTEQASLALACKPYTDQGPYRFLRSFLVTLLPSGQKE